ncbi:Gfo/Idh/MocA family oxidoreductase [Paenibacillus sp. N3/727]|uniref:Gfo/Idh/MocA family protein n=1 Tax=Paenibacillus sp. N3/727 TaxID=2925845 RepID=UPI001F533625|nr:Gfo/Idh/MocA family oxidoreductase [Paenibacillus sp. N3/727]UNK19189.1 Gfo/Idh/MocA family oxidoreductase [Paenibacillus sp. N3/727]
MNIAIIGCGTMGMTHAHNLGKMPGVKVSGVADLIQKRADQAAEACGAVPYKDWEQMLEQVKPDTVAVCLPTYLHKSFVLKLAERGLHIICEKPAALTLEDAKAMEAACSKHGVRLFIGHVVRFFPNYRNAFDQVRSGKIGEAKMAHFKRHGSYPLGVSFWYRDRSKSGGVIMDLMIHDIDFACWLFGDVESVYASVTKPSLSMEYAQVTLKFSSGAIANLTGFWGYAGPFTTQFEISGKEGIIRFDSNQVQSLDLKVATGGDDQKVAVQVPSSPTLHDPYYDEVKHFIECIREGSEPIVSVADACRAVEIALACEHSAQTGQPVRMGGITS